MTDKDLVLKIQKTADEIQESMEQQKNFIEDGTRYFKDLVEAHQKGMTDTIQGEDGKVRLHIRPEFYDNEEDYQRSVFYEQLENNEEDMER